MITMTVAVEEKTAEATAVGWELVKKNATGQEEHTTIALQCAMMGVLRYIASLGNKVTVISGDDIEKAVAAMFRKELGE